MKKCFLGNIYIVICLTCSTIQSQNSVSPASKKLKSLNTIREQWCFYYWLPPFIYGPLLRLRLYIHFCMANNHHICLQDFLKMLKNVSFVFTTCKVMLVAIKIFQTHNNVLPVSKGLKISIRMIPFSLNRFSENG